MHIDREMNDISLGPPALYHGRTTKPYKQQWLNGCWGAYIVFASAIGQSSLKINMFIPMLQQVIMVKSYENKLSFEAKTRR